MENTTIVIGTNRPESITSQIAFKLDPDTAYLFTGEPPKTNSFTNFQENIIWIIPTYHGTLSGYSKMVLDSLTDETLAGFLNKKHFIVSSSPSNVGMKDFAKTLHYAIKYQYKDIDPIMDIIQIGMPEGSQYGVVEDSYIEFIKSYIK